ncbi:hypothetical protein ACJX0J_022436, partial [Zea mays]
MYKMKRKELMQAVTAASLYQSLFLIILGLVVILAPSIHYNLLALKQDLVNLFFGDFIVHPLVLAAHFPFIPFYNVSLRWATAYLCCADATL